MKELSRSSSSREELLEDEPLKDGFLKETPLDDFSFEYGLPSETLPKDLSSKDGSPKEILLDDFSLKDDFSGERLCEEDCSDEEEDSETAHIRHNITRSLRTAIEWCDEIANTQDDFITNFKSHLPFLVVLGLIILLLWALRIFYG